MINIFSKEQIINIKLVLGESIVYVNGTKLITGTSSQCMSKIRSIITQTSYSLQNDNLIRFIIESEVISAETVNDRSFFINQIRLLSTCCKCKIDLKAGIHYIC